MKTIIDSISKRLLQAIQQDARISNQDLADKIGISPSPCLQRRKRLEDLGIITGYDARIDLSRLTTHVEVIAEITLNNNKATDEKRFREYIETIPEIVSCHGVTGNVDYFAMFCAPSVQHYLAVVDQMIETLGIIETVTSHVVYGTTKPYRGFPLDLLLKD
ncbi:MAG: AsnC family transcriptional regulator [Alphaproteobacteria bacterium HGW-Alphaproteobacteria-18]|nr:MAG: AsnC family transcriptional regulator [Alphaproteobacteria bacterium HGW-Alphaproteobacteria-18]